MEEKVKGDEEVKREYGGQGSGRPEMVPPPRRRGSGWREEYHRFAEGVTVVLGRRCSGAQRRRRQFSLRACSTRGLTKVKEEGLGSYQNAPLTPGEWGGCRSFFHRTLRRAVSLGPGGASARGRARG